MSWPMRIVEAGDRVYRLCPVESLGCDGSAAGSADEQHAHVGSVHEPVRDRSEH
jgi:hypothetical protein